MDSLKGRHALVTGGGGGIGRTVAAALTAAGAAVTVMGRGEGSLRETVEAGDAQGFAVADVTDAAALSSGIEFAAGLRGPIDILVANAGGAASAPFARTDAALFRRMFELNLMGTVNAAHAVLGGMVERGFGRIVAVASTAGLKGYAYVSAYAAAKHAVVGLVRSLAVETARTGVTVNAVCPGYTDTEMLRQSLDDMAARTGRSREDLLKSVLAGNPQGRPVKPGEVAAAVVYLCSPQAAAVTGTTLAVAGGEV